MERISIEFRIAISVMLILGCLAVAIYQYGDYRERFYKKRHMKEMKDSLEIEVLKAKLKYYGKSDL